MLAENAAFIESIKLRDIHFDPESMRSAASMYTEKKEMVTA